MQDMDEQKADPYLFPAKASEELLRRMPNTVIIEAEFDFYLTETTRPVNHHVPGILYSNGHEIYRTNMFFKILNQHFFTQSRYSERKLKT